MTQILGNLSKNSLKRNITQTRPSAQCPLLPSVQSSHSFTHPSFCPSSPSLSVYTSTLSTCSLRPSALSVHPSVCQLCPFHPSTLCCPSIQTVQLVCLFSPSICSSVRLFVHPVCLAVRSVCPSTLRMATRTAVLYVRVQIQLETSTFHAFFGRKGKTTIFHSDKVFYN